MQDSIARARDGLRRVQAMRPLLVGCLALALAACQAASPPPAANAAADAPMATPAASASSPSAAPGDAPGIASPSDAATPPASPPASAPPARATPVADAAEPGPPAPSPADPGRALVDRCSSDADCEVKDVGSCCGYRPRCLHRDSPTFADEVKARCKAEGRVSHCGITAVAGCTCEAGRCVDVASTDNQLVQ